MRNGERYSEAAITEPSWRDDFKKYARIDFSQDDELISDQLKSARIWFERQTSIVTITRSITMTLDAFPRGVIVVRIAPLTSVTSVGYVDPNGDAQVWASNQYTVDLGDEVNFGTIRPDTSYDYPSTDDNVADVTVIFVAGYADADSVPINYRDVIFGYAEDLYNRMPGPSENTLAKLAACGGPLLYA